MKTILLIAVILCSAFARHHGHRNRGPESEAHRQLFQKCKNEAGISSRETRALRNVAANETLSSPQQTLICCLSASKIQNKQLNTTSIQNMIDEHKCPESANVDLSNAVSECESLTGVSASNLGTCEMIARFMHCLFSKLYGQSTKSAEDSE